jgi:hypothetical protein
MIKRFKVASCTSDGAARSKALAELYNKDGVDTTVFMFDTIERMVYVTGSDGEVDEQEIYRYPLSYDVQQIVKQIKVKIDVALDYNIIEEAVYVCDELFGVDDKIYVLIIESAEGRIDTIIGSMFVYSDFVSINNVHSSNTPALSTEIFADVLITHGKVV